MFTRIFFLGLTVLLAASSSFIPLSSASTDVLCANSLSQRSCRLCGSLFNELQPADCCTDPVLGALCQSFIDSLSANDKRYFVGKRNGVGAAHGLARVSLGKKNRNTFLGKRFEEAAVYDENLDGLSDGGAVDGLMTSSEASKRQRNKFLGKRVARSAGAPQQEEERDDGRISRLIKQFVDRLAAELTLEKSSRSASHHGGAPGPNGVESTENDWTAGAADTAERMERDQRAKNTFLG